MVLDDRWRCWDVSLSWSYGWSASLASLFVVGALVRPDKILSHRQYSVPWQISLCFGGGQCRCEHVRHPREDVEKKLYQWDILFVCVLSGIDWWCCVLCFMQEGLLGTGHFFCLVGLQLFKKQKVEPFCHIFTRDFVGLLCLQLGVVTFLSFVLVKFRKKIEGVRRSIHCFSLFRPRFPRPVKTSKKPNFLEATEEGLRLARFWRRLSGGCWGPLVFIFWCQCVLA